MNSRTIKHEGSYTTAVSNLLFCSVTNASNSVPRIMSMQCTELRLVAKPGTHLVLEDRKKDKLKTPHRPSNQNVVVFFKYMAVYNQLRPSLIPPDDAPGRVHPWLVEPGLHSMEVYLDILEPWPAQPLRRYMCRVRHVLRMKDPEYNTVGPRPRRVDCTRWEPRDVCFTLLSYAEHHAVSSEFWLLGLQPGATHLAVTPAGMLNMATADGLARIAACGHLRVVGGEDEPCKAKYQGSALPPGVKRIGSGGIEKWALPSESPGAKKRGLSLDDTGFVRLLWECEGQSLADASLME
ncbi:hypothetical protein LEL_02122 [Akanthomyces lecanii RCEF 1005]|uniref:Uncharacterized protein n=1 Tax=Akanthomyces lecanii RCEF 1005 TaxID=1081108 RepID=A0A168L1G0_CORDF|nr:hypothetical protein LEL_02122 [Akanthomyces lecanii RCEF 1005]